VHEFQQLVDQLNRRLRADGITKRRRNDRRYVGLHVLGRGVSGDKARLYDATEFV